ncbi:MAG: hypothetical protein A2539_03225 [Elusimicrobia bacterium RIFOXYD2_FULL_34_15]|nr:MAG: hypothetical protein A2539_03225 [Elusimicrobia bacterium RIFOXYD2_FULL_34_15]HAM39258.1 hypothetical protein [Elusimicrobiota bacterium]
MEKRFELKIDLSYKTKLLLSILTVSAIMLIILTLSQITFLRNTLIERTLIRVKTVEALLNEIVLDNIIEKDINSIKKSIVLITRQPFIEFISIIDNNDKIILSSNNSLENRINPNKDSKDIREVEKIFIKSFPLEKDKKRYGYVQVGFSLQKLTKDIETATYRSFGISIVAILLIIGVAWIISDKLLNPLREMKNISDIIAKGDFSKRLNIKTKDIIGELGISLNSMAEQLYDLTNNLNRKIKEATLELEESNKKLKELDNLKSEFVSLVSHELRTPLTAIIGFAKANRTLDLTEKQKRKYLLIIENEGKRLAKIIEDFLDISKIESGKFVLDITDIDVPELISEIINSIKIPENIKINVELSKNFPKLYADRNRLKQVIINIIGNALKYTLSGGKITICGEYTDEDIIISIKDDGPGIKKEELEKIFNKFYRGNDDVSSENEGSGLGLSISKGIIEMHKGNIWAESEFGKGSKFIFSLPRE